MLRLSSTANNMNVDIISMNDLISSSRLLIQEIWIIIYNIMLKLARYREYGEQLTDPPSIGAEQKHNRTRAVLLLSLNIEYFPI